MPLSTSVPALTVVPPCCEAVPFTTMVPWPFFTRPPVLAMLPLLVKVLPASVVKLPPASTMSRAVSKLPVVRSVPPLSARSEEASPRLASRFICSVPPLTVVPPV